MNAAATSDNGGSCSDSDTNSDESAEYYQPVSNEDDVRESPDQDPNPNYNRLPNGCLENGVLSDEDTEDDEEDDDDFVEEAVESDRAIERAFREDEVRRSAPLSAENAGRVVEAMRRVSFGGSAPEWADRVPEDQWMDRIRGLRRRTPAE